MTAFIVILAGLGVLSMLGALVLVPCLCAMVTGRALSWVFQVEPDPSVPNVKELLSTECLASKEELVRELERISTDSASAG